MKMAQTHRNIALYLDGKSAKSASDIETHCILTGNSAVYMYLQRMFKLGWLEKTIFSDNTTEYTLTSLGEAAIAYDTARKLATEEEEVTNEPA